MGISLRCCLACVLPCGALDLIRIVHLNGYVEEITRPVTAGDILQAYPNHVLSKPCSQGVELVPRILILSPDSELKKGSIYFLVPDPSVKGNKKSQAAAAIQKRSPKKSGSKIGKDDVDRLFPDQVVVVPEKKSKSSRRDRRSKGEVSSWMPHLESIRED